MTWMATKVEMSFCALCGSGSEISWHLDVPFFFIFFFGAPHQCCTGTNTNTHLGIALFLPHFVPNMSPWTVHTVVALRARGVWGMLLGILRWGIWPSKGFRENLQSEALYMPLHPPPRQTDTERGRGRYLNAPGLCLRAGQTQRSRRHTYSIQTLLIWAAYAMWQKKKTSRTTRICYVWFFSFSNGDLKMIIKDMWTPWLWPLILHRMTQNTFRYRIIQLPLQLQSFLKNCMMPCAHSWP